jgi:hypothetical protein
MEKGEDSQVVQPGDALSDGSATVSSITDSQVTLKTNGTPSAEIVLGVSVADTSQTNQTPGAPAQ